MKAKTFLFVSFLSMTAMFNSCGTSKNTSNENSALVGTMEGTQIQNDICETLAEEKPGIRAFGNGQHFRLATAQNIAAAQARAKLAAAMGQRILSVLKTGDVKDEQYAGSDDEGMKVNDGIAVDESKLLAIANEIVSGAVIIKTSKYIKPNKQYNVYVCVEYSDSPKTIAEKTVSKVKQLIPDSKKEELNDRMDKLMDEIEYDLSRNLK